MSDTSGNISDEPIKWVPMTKPNSGKVVLVVDAGSVKTKPDYVDLVELEPGARSPIVVRAGF